MKFLREVLEILQPWADAVVSGLARKPKGTRFPNGTPRVELTVKPERRELNFSVVVNDDFHELQRRWIEESLKWDLPEDPFDPSDWLDDIDWDDWDEVGKTSHGDPVYIKPMSNGREHG